MKKLFQSLACIFVLGCAAYGAYVLVNKFLTVRRYKDICEFDDLYNEYVATHKE